MAAMAGETVSALGKRSFIVLDAYFAVGPVFLILRQVSNDQGERLIHLITRAKSNVVAYQEPPPRSGKRGRPRKYGAKLCLMDLFESMADHFERTTLSLYGQAKDVSFLCLDLIWRPIDEKVRFILVRDGSDTFILMCSDLTLSPYDIIRSYNKQPPVQRVVLMSPL